MKKLILSISIILSAYGTMGQCVPDISITGPGIFPPAGSTVNGDGTINLPDGAINSFYDQVIQVRVPNDTTVVFAGNNVNANVDSFRVEFINGLPAGLNYNCDNSTCNWAGGANGCVRIFGTPTGPVQNNELSVGIRAYLRIFSIPIDTLQLEERYQIQVNNAVSLVEKTRARLDLYPNPTRGQVNLNLDNIDPQRVRWNIIDLSGRLISQGSFDHFPGQSQSIDLSGTASGLYLIQLSTNEGNLTRRLIIDE